MIENYYFKLDGKTPVPLDSIHELAVIMGDDKMRRVALDEVGPFSISTVFLFINHDFFNHGEPVLFETMVFQDGTEFYREDFELMDRYCTWDRAIEGHKRICEQVRDVYEADVEAETK